MKTKIKLCLVIFLIHVSLSSSINFTSRLQQDRLLLEAIADTSGNNTIHKILPIIDNTGFELLSAENCRCELSETFRLRDISFNVLTAYPDSVVCNNDTIRIELSRPENFSFDLASPAASFLRMYCSLFPEQAELERWREIEPAQPNILFIYPENDVPIFWEVYNYLKEWKRQKGYKIYEYEYSGEGCEAIKNYIQDAYDNWEEPPEYICIIGDAGGSFNVPTAYYSGGEGDHYYTTLAGEDQISDVHIGRLSFNSISEWQTIVFKIVMYEREPYIEDSSWFNRALLVGDPTTSGSSCVYTNINIRELIENNFAEFNFLELYEAPFMPAMQELANQGVSYFNYRGFWGMSNWQAGTPAYMSNGMMLPFAVISTCATGDFAGEGYCRSEYFIRAGTTGNPRGGIGAIGTATTATHTCFNNCFVMGVAYGLFAEDLRTMGASHTRGKTGLWLNYPQNPDEASTRFSYWNNLIGDPTIEIWNQEPEQVSIECAESYSVSNEFVTVRILGEYGEPRSGLECCLTDSTSDYQNFCFSNNEGYAVFPLEGIESGNTLLTVSGDQSYPVQQEIQIAGINGISITEIDFIDESGNGSFEPSETGNPVISIHNDYTVVIDSVYLNIEVLSSEFTIENSSIFISEILPDEEIVIDETIMQFNPTTETDRQFLSVSVSFDTISFSNTYQIPLTELEITLNTFQFTDNNNNIPETGETVYLDFELENTGEDVLNNLIVELNSSSNLAIVSEGVFTIESLSPEDIYTPEESLEIIIEEEFIAGNTLQLNLVFSTEEGFFQEISISEEIGNESSTEPQGPDGGGYCIYDENDLEYLDVEYDWIEINNTELLPLTDNGDEGDIYQVELPFDLRFYGEEYNSLSICTNGWVAPGYTESASFMNWSIPGEGGVSPMIAVFWDDLKTGTGGIYEHYIEDEHLYVIEWDDMQNDWDNSEESFELIIYDREFYPSSNGNNILKMQYKVFNNVNEGTYSGYHEGNHGQFATIGIENQTGTIGLQYSYNNDYDGTGSELSDESALVISGEPVPDDTEWIVIAGFSFRDENGEEFIVPGENTSLEIELLNIGSADCNGLDIYLECSNQSGIEIFNHHSNIEHIQAGGIQITDFDFYIDEDFSPLEELEFIIDLESTSRHWYYTIKGRVTAPVIDTETEEILFGDVFLSYTAEKTLKLTNRGTAPLEISEIQTSTYSLTIEPGTLSIEPNQSDTLYICYTADETGTFLEYFTICSNSVTDSILMIETRGTVVSAPQIETDTNTHFLEVEDGEQYAYNLEVFNTGEGVLQCEAELSGYCNSGLGAIFSGGYLELNQPVITTNEFSIEAWARIDGPGFHVYQTNTIYCQRDNECGEVHPKVILFARTSSGYTRMELSGNCGSLSDVTYTAPPLGEWHHYCGTVNDDFLCLYIDGNLVASEYNNEDGNYYQGLDYFDIGAHRFSNTLKASLNGMIDELRFWNRALDIEEINAIKNHSVPLDSEGLHAYWKFNEYGNWNDLINASINATPQLQVSQQSSNAMINDWSELITNGLEINSNESGVITLEIDPSWLSLGENYATSIIINSNDPENPQITVPFHISVIPESINENELPSLNSISQNYPNPFIINAKRNRTTAINYSLSESSSNAEIIIYNVKGQKVRSFSLNPEKKQIIWDGNNSSNQQAGSGIYYYQLKVDGKVCSAKKLMLLR